MRLQTQRELLYLDLGLTGVYHELGPYEFGDVGDKPVTGDWDGDGDDNIGVYRPSNEQFYRDSNTPPDTNNPPNTPSPPSGPGSGNTGTSYSYSTSATDPDGDQVKYTFNWGDGTTSETGFVNSGTSASRSHSWSSAGTYYVKAKATDTTGASSGWSGLKSVTITNPNNPPYTPSNPSPSNHATGQSINADLSWTGGDPDAGDAVKYDVFFGTSTSPPRVSNDQSGTNYDPGTLSYDTKYYWKITATDNHGTSTSGPLWDFTTGSAPNNAPTLSSGSVNPSSGDTSTTFNYYVTYTDSDGDAPTTKYVYVDGSPHTMMMISGDYTSGATFKYSTTLSAGSHNYYFYFDDDHGHTVRLPTSGTISGPSVSTIDTTPPASITNLQSITGQTWINWTWDNPPDSDFNHTMMYLNGTWKANTSDPFCNVTGLNPETCREIATHTVDKVGNINWTWINDTATTLPAACTPPDIAWNMTISATNQLEPVVVGMHPTATDGYGAEFDLFAETPAQGKVILILDDIYSTSIKKTRCYNESVSWSMSAGVPTGQTTTLSWNVPDYLNLTILEGTEILPSGSQLDEGSHELTVIAELLEFQEFGINLKAGWNMVSVPLIMDNNSVHAVFGDIPTLDTMPVKTWQSPLFIDATEIYPKVGYWVFTPTNAVITVTGTPIQNTTLYLGAGWNSNSRSGVYPALLVLLIELLVLR